jgi:hypothetical protein
VVSYSLHLRPAPDGSSVVEVTFDLTGEQLEAAAHGVRAVVSDRYRVTRIESGDDVVAMRDFTTLGDEMVALAVPGAYSRLTLTTAQVGRLRAALEEYLGTRSDGEALRAGDGEALPHVYAIVDGIADAHAEAVRTALDDAPQPAR